VSKHIGISGAEFSIAIALGVNEDCWSFGEEAIHPSSNPTMSRICTHKILTRHAVLVACWAVYFSLYLLFCWWPGGPWAVHAGHWFGPLFYLSIATNHSIQQIFLELDIGPGPD
jgi:hypothetical protein